MQAGADVGKASQLSAKAPGPPTSGAEQHSYDNQGTTQVKMENLQ